MFLQLKVFTRQAYSLDSTKILEFSPSSKSFYSPANKRKDVVFALEIPESKDPVRLQDLLLKLLKADSHDFNHNQSLSKTPKSSKKKRKASKKAATPVKNTAEDMDDGDDDDDDDVSKSPPSPLVVEASFSFPFCQLSHLIFPLAFLFWAWGDCDWMHRLTIQHHFPLRRKPAGMSIKIRLV